MAGKSAAEILGAVPVDDASTTEPSAPSIAPISDAAKSLGAIPVDQYAARGGPTTVKDAFPTTIGGVVGQVGEALGRPVAVVQDLIGRAQKGEPMTSAVPKAAEQMKAPGFKDRGITFEDILATHAIQNGQDPRLAKTAAAAIGPVLRMAADPLNLIDPAVKGITGLSGVGEISELASGLAKTGHGIDMADAASQAATKLEEVRRTGLNKIIASVFGPGEDAIAAYKANPGILDQAKGVEGIKNAIDDQVGKVNSIAADKKVAADKALQNWNDAHQTQLDVLRQTPKPQELAPQVTQSIKDLDHQVSTGSSVAFDIADKKGIKFPTALLKQDFQTRINGMTSTAMITPEGRAAKANLEAIRANMDELPPELTGSQMKEKIQELDSAIDYDGKTGTRTSPEDKILRGTRRFLDSKLKDDPEYAQVMDQVSKDTKLLSQARDLFGDEMTLPSKLSNIHAENAAPRLKVLKDLGERTGHDFETPVNEFKGADAILRDPKLKEQLRHGLVDEKAAHEASMFESKTMQDTADRLNSMASKKQSGGLVDQLLMPKAPDKGGMIEKQRLIDELDSMRGIDTSNPGRAEGIRGLINAERVAQSFKKGNPMGSANTVLGGLVGHVFGNKAAEVAGAVGGRMIDRYGGQMAKSVIDAEVAARVNGAKIVGTTKPLTKVIKVIQKYPNVAGEIMRQVGSIPPGSEGPQTVSIRDPQVLQEAAAALKESDELDSVEKSKMLSNLADTGHLEIQLGEVPQAPQKAALTPKRLQTIQGISDSMKRVMTP